MTAKHTRFLTLDIATAALSRFVLYTRAEGQSVSGPKARTRSIAAVLTAQ